jgi:molybdopterin molybdotransferase
MNAIDRLAAPATLIPLDEALAMLAERLQPVVPIETVPTMGAERRVLAEDVVAEVSAPPFPSSGMDGYAFRFADLPASGPAVLRIGARVAAGHVHDGELSSGEAARIFTGAPVPKGLDTVAMQEDCRVEGDRVHLPRSARAGDHVRRKGMDFDAGDTVLARGRRLRPQDVAVAAAAGRANLRVYARLRVGVFSTGDELVEPGQPLPDGAIYNCNRYAIAALAGGMGCDVTDLGNIPDSLDETVRRLRDAAGRCDLLMTSGGVSVGGEDHVRAAVGQLGAIHLWRMAVKPGKPTAIGEVCGVPFVGLPGYPVSSMVTFMMVARPAILRLSGAEAEPLRPHRFAVRSAFSFDKDEQRRQFLRASLRAGDDGRLEAVLYRNQESNVVSSLVHSDGLVDLAESLGRVRPGDVVDFIPYAALQW